MIPPEKIAAYVADNGMHCPHCGSRNLHWGALDSNVAGATQDVTCTDCNAVWCDEHTLTGLIELEEGDFREAE